MSDFSVADALRSDEPLVVIEAPAGCGKTHQAAAYVADVADSISTGRVLVLAHTHAACDTFAERSPGRARVDVRTIDSLVVAVASAYPTGVHINGDVGSWARVRKNGYEELAERVSRLLAKCPGIARMLARRYPVVVCDEHQDANADQHAIIMALGKAGTRLRVFGDPMQALFDNGADGDSATERWSELNAAASRSETLDQPHRWESATELGKWILEARELLRSGGKLDLTNRPEGLAVIVADDLARARGRYQLSKAERRPIDRATVTSDDMFILSSQTMTVNALRSFFNRRFPIWEGHVRDALGKLVDALSKYEDDAARIAKATLKFTDKVCTGFSASVFGNTLLDEIGRGCTPPRRGKPGTLQELGKLILEQPNHQGMSEFLRRLFDETRDNSVFSGIKIDYPREFWDAVALGDFPTAVEGMSQIALRRSTSRSSPPNQAISTIHKAKGLERSSVIIMPCDEIHFPDTPKARRILYVALSRATKNLALVIPRKNPSPLFNR